MPEPDPGRNPVPVSGSDSVPGAHAGVSGNSGHRDYAATVSILEGIRDAIFILDDAGMIEYVNRSALGLLGLSLTEVLGSSILEFVQPLEVQTSLDLENFKEVLQQGVEVFESQEATLMGRGGMLPVLLDLGSIPSGKEGPRYRILTAKELSFRKTIEREVERRRAQTVSRDRMRVLGQMSVGLVHQMGQPLASLQLQIQDMMRLATAEKMDREVLLERAGQIDTQLKRLAKIHDRVRQFALQRRGMGNTAVDLASVLDDAIASQDYVLHEAGVEIKLVLPGDLPTVSVNQPGLEEVLAILLNNAREAYEKWRGEGRPSIILQARAVDGKWVWLDVLDHAGQSEEGLSMRIFEPFYTGKPDDQHMGTGLTIARSIIQGFGGELRYHQTANGWTDFRIVLPLEATDERDQLYNLIEILHQQ